MLEIKEFEGYLFCEDEHFQSIIADVSESKEFDSEGTIFAGHVPLSHKEREDYVRVMKAAPNLLEACKLALKLYWGTETPKGIERIKACIQAAITKAKGG